MLISSFPFSIQSFLPSKKWLEDNNFPHSSTFWNSGLSGGIWGGMMGTITAYPYIRKTFAREVDFKIATCFQKKPSWELSPLMISEKNALAESRYLHKVLRTGAISSLCFTLPFVFWEQWQAVQNGQKSPGQAIFAGIGDLAVSMMAGAIGTNIGYSTSLALGRSLPRLGNLFGTLMGAAWGGAMGILAYGAKEGL